MQAAQFPHLTPAHNTYTTCLTPVHNEYIFPVLFSNRPPWWLSPAIRSRVL